MILILMLHRHAGTTSKILMHRHHVTGRKIPILTYHLLVVERMTPTPTCHLLVGPTKKILMFPLHVGRGKIQTPTCRLPDEGVSQTQTHHRQE